MNFYKPFCWYCYSQIFQFWKWGVFWKLRIFKKLILIFQKSWIVFKNFGFSQVFHAHVYKMNHNQNKIMKKQQLVVTLSFYLYNREVHSFTKLSQILSTDWIHQETLYRRPLQVLPNTAHTTSSDHSYGKTRQKYSSLTIFWRFSTDPFAEELLKKVNDIIIP